MGACVDPSPDPPLSSLAPSELGAAVVLAWLSFAGEGVGCDSASGASTSLSPCVDPELEDVLLAVALASGSTSFKRGLTAAARVPWREPATLPSSTPKPRNTSTSRAETRGWGRRGPPPRMGSSAARAAGTVPAPGVGPVAAGGEAGAGAGGGGGGG